MRILIRIAVVAAALFAAALVALAVMLPRVVASDAVRARIEAAADAAIGRKVAYRELSFGLLPPSLVVVEPSVAGASEKAPALVEAERVSLRVALAPLLARAVVVDSLVVEGARLRLERNRDGLVLPRPAGAAGGAGGEAAGAEAPVALALRSVELRDASVELRDAAVAPAVTWQLQDVDARVRGRSLEEPFDVSASAQLASGGRISVEGSAGLGGEIDLAVDLDALAVSPLKPYVEDVSELGGAVTGRVSARGPARAPSDVALDVSVRDGALHLGEVQVRGAMQLEAKLADAGRGSFEIDATGAEVTYAGVHTRPAGERKTLTGNLVRHGDGTLEVSDWQLHAGPVDGSGSARIGKRVQLVANVAPVDLAELQAFVPALAEYRVSGPFRLDGFSVATAPLELRGDIPLDGVKAELPDGGPVVLRGGLVAAGDVVRTRDLMLVAADQTIRVEGTVSGLGGDLRYDFHTETQKADSNRLLSTFTSNRDRLFGPLDFRGDVKGSLGGARSPLESLAGNMSVDITPGRLVGVSMLEAAFQHFDPTGLLGALGLGGLTRAFAPSLERYYGEDFQELRATLAIADGIARTNDFLLAYEAYRVDLAGQIGLVDLALDMRGKLTLGPDLSGSLAKALGAKLRQPGQSLVVPLPTVGGTLSDPKVRPDFGHLTAALIGNVPLVGPQLEGPAGEALKGLGDLLGGGRR